MTQLLILHSDIATRAAIASVADYHGFAARVAESVDDALNLATTPGERVCIVADIADALPLLNGPLRLPPIIVLSAKPDVRAAVNAIKAGASDFIGWPSEPIDLIAAIERALAERASRAPGRQADCNILGDSPTMRQLFESLHRIGPSETTVLITGESGTGKTLVANALHRASPRAQGPFVTFSCGSLPAGAIETELFGYGNSDDPDNRSRQGLLEAADGGTLFLDGIDELELPAQTRLLRVLESGEIRRLGASVCEPVAIRLIASTRRDMPALVATGRFREDLYHRLSVVRIDVPPLRQRGEDVLLLADSALSRLSTRLGREPSRLDADARQALLRYHWPGNVRELESAIERALILSDSRLITAQLLSLSPTSTGQYASATGVKITTAETREGAEPQALGPPQTSLEGYFVSFVLTHQDQLSETELANRLGISRKSLWERRQRLNIPRRRITARFEPQSDPLRKS
ncbi:MAG: sigma-54-dependent transcriptional regulator [Pseudomonadales bacterium]